jgi:hypothetical protein
VSIDQTDVVDLATIDKASGDLWLTIVDHLPWDENEGDHLILLQNKLNAYLRFKESGEIFEKVRGSKVNLLAHSLRLRLDAPQTFVARPGVFLWLRA